MLWWKVVVEDKRDKSSGVVVKKDKPSSRKHLSN